MQAADDAPAADDERWAFGDTPSLRSLLHGAPRHGASREYQDALRASASFHAPSALAAMAAALGAAGVAEGMSGSLLLDLPGGQRAAELRRHIKDKVDLAWSNEALARGVAEAKAGARRPTVYRPGAHRCSRPQPRSWPQAAAAARPPLPAPRRPAAAGRRAQAATRRRTAGTPRRSSCLGPTWTRWWPGARRTPASTTLRRRRRTCAPRWSWTPAAPTPPGTWG